jgi:hypothetical protein
MIAIDGPVYVGQPVWIRAIAGPEANIHYPFHTEARDIGCNRLEVRRNGVALAPTPVRATNSNVSGLLCGSAAPIGSPQNRLPLNLLYPLDQVGTYSVRWTNEDVSFTLQRQLQFEPRAQSAWLTFTVLAATPEQHEAWLKNLLTHAPEDDGQLAGDFLPSLMAAAPDSRALDTLVKYLYADNSMVAGMAASALEDFPRPEALRAVVRSLEEHGPSEQLAYFATYHTGWTLDDQDKIVHAAIPYLRSNNPTLPSGKPLPPYAPTQTSAALTLLRFIFYIPNRAWPASPELAFYADTQVLQAAPDVIANANMFAVQELAEYLSAMEPSPRTHQLLLQIAERSDTAGEQARICLRSHPQPGDLPHLATFLMASGDADASGRDRSSLPDSLVMAYGEDALPYLERATASSPYVWVRVKSAQQLAFRYQPIGLQFLLDAIEANQPYKTEIIQWIRGAFSGQLTPGANEQQIATFLRSQIAPGH